MSKSSTIQYRVSQSTDMPGILSLLKENKLPVSDIEPGRIDFIVALSGDNIIGCVGVEQFDTEGLFRSFAVSSAYRNHQIGGELFNRLLSHAAQSGIQSLHLLTTTAEEYFKRRGFITAKRTQAPDAISTTAEFSSLCPSSSAYMMMPDLGKKTPGYYQDTQRSYTDQQSGSTYWSIQGANLQLTSFEIPPHTEFEKHRHAAEQITYVLEGELFFETGSAVHRLCKGDSIVLLANTEHRVWTGAVAARALDAWSPINQKYNPVNNKT